MSRNVRSAATRAGAEMVSRFSRNTRLSCERALLPGIARLRGEPHRALGGLEPFGSGEEAASIPELTNVRTASVGASGNHVVSPSSGELIWLSRCYGLLTCASDKRIETRVTVKRTEIRICFDLRKRLWGAGGRWLRSIVRAPHRAGPDGRQSKTGYIWFERFPGGPGRGRDAEFQASAATSLLPRCRDP
jgi:hypothetical protein